MRYIHVIGLIIVTFISFACNSNKETNNLEQEMKTLYGKNEQMIDTYDTIRAAKTSNGFFIGKENDGITSYKGIPYALPPTGKLRWKPAKQLPPNNNLYEAYYFGKATIQTKSESELASLYVQGEDCLTLNIWANLNEKTNLKPVMVWIHGGSYGWGGTVDPIYDGHNFVKAHSDIVLVTINYRTGILGFMDLSSMPGGEDYKESANLGILDQIEALKWIQKNISSFGGDPDNVTIFGESAGAGSVCILSCMDLAKDLFKKVIAESGSVALTNNREECQKLPHMLMDKAKASCVEDLIKLSEEEIIKLNEELNEYNTFPMRDGYLIPENLYEQFSDGYNKDIDFLIGTNKDESRYWIGELGGKIPYTISMNIWFENIQKRLNKDKQKNINEFMDLQGGDGIWDLTEFFNDLMFRVPASTMAEEHSKNGGNTYVYYWTYPSALPEYGACHAVELSSVFNNPNEDIYTGKNYNKELASEVQNMWVNFAKTGNPSTEKYKWEQYNIETRKSMILGENISIESDLLSQQRVAIQPLVYDYISPLYSDLSLNVPYVWHKVFIIISIILVPLVLYIYKKKSKRKR